MMKKNTGILIALIMAACLLGCGADETKTTTVSLDKKGKIINTIYEDFGEEYYDISELTRMAEDEIALFNSERLSEKITLGSVDKISDGTMVKMVLNFETTDDYEDFNNTTLYYGTVQDAMDRGYEISSELIDENGLKVSLEAVENNKNNHIIITKDKSVFITPYNIVYTTNGVSLKGKKEAVLSSSTNDEIQLILSK
ncbi:MAG: hypothetical protein J6O61_15175 [Butyrivibrio sp.]|uniref:hypothetical protein n=1 Tax=Butyrivibrio sp. TaxID=28121 RepID=UPI001B0C10BF|nr:hypothetical protein [Butyrivibrio sp.]MBO6242145.1 hypothetical protein [Butyrivibrio sp.]